MRCSRPALLSAMMLSVAPPVFAGSIEPCDADLDRSGVVGSGDLNLILASFGISAGGDITGDGVTNSTDLNVLLAAFGMIGCTSDVGSCCTPNGTPGCDHASCESAVCAFDAACCQVVWDFTCVMFAGDFCAGHCPPVVFDGDCCEPNLSPGCEDRDCTDLICSAEPFCCEVVWDGPCVAAALASCSQCLPQTGKPDCCEPHKTAGCEDERCEEMICLMDVYCCDEEWDEVCAEFALVFCWICD